MSMMIILFGVLNKGPDEFWRKGQGEAKSESRKFTLSPSPSLRRGPDYLI